MASRPLPGQRSHRSKVSSHQVPTTRKEENPTPARDAVLPLSTSQAPGRLAGPSPKAHAAPARAQQSDINVKLAPEGDLKRKRKRGSALARAPNFEPKFGEAVDGKFPRIQNPSGPPTIYSTFESDERSAKTRSHLLGSASRKHAGSRDRNARSNIAYLASERKSPSSSRRPRLIDALTASRSACSASSHSLNALRSFETAGEGFDSTAAGEITPDKNMRPRSAGWREGTPTSRKIKVTYGQYKRVSNETQSLNTPNPYQSAAKETGLKPSSADASPAQDAYAGEFVEDNVDLPAIKSVHELRRSGAKNRFVDEMDDLLTRIGMPDTGSASTRRSALCELAQSLPRESFAEQFRNHPSRNKITKGLGRERDLLSGFALASALVIFFQSGPAPHLVHRLAEDGVGSLLSLLLRVNEDIDTMIIHENLRSFPTTKASLRSIKRVLIDWPIWHGMKLTLISPRAIGLQLLMTLAKFGEVSFLEKIAADLCHDLSLVAAQASDTTETTAEAEYALVVFTLEHLSNAGLWAWLSSRGPIMVSMQQSVAKILAKALHEWPREHGELKSASLKLAINATNTRSEATAFANADLTSCLADRIASGYARVKSDVWTGPLESDLYDQLILLLGVMINIMEHSPTARASLNDDVLDRLAQLWHEDRRIVGEADSVDQSKVSVALGYLAILLGYLSLATSGKAKINGQLGNVNGVRVLAKSIREFIAMHKMVDNRVCELESLITELCNHCALDGGNAASL